MSGTYARRFARKDANHATLVKFWEGLGGSAIDMSSLGGGRPDTLLSANGRDALVEIKVKGNGLTDDQAKFLLKHRGSPIHIIETEADLRALHRTLTA